MKQFILLASFFFLSTLSFAQIKASEATAITPEVLQKIKAEADKAAIKFKQLLVKENNLSKEAIAYSVETFKLQQIADKRTDINYTAHSLNQATYEMADGYDKLMNKYYKKLLQMLEPNDKKVLIDA